MYQKMLLSTALLFHHIKIEIATLFRTQPKKVFAQERFEKKSKFPLCLVLSKPDLQIDPNNVATETAHTWPA